jgi:hypothetical protein
MPKTRSAEIGPRHVKSSGAVARPVGRPGLVGALPSSGPISGHTTKAGIAGRMPSTMRSHHGSERRLQRTSGHPQHRSSPHGDRPCGPFVGSASAHSEGRSPLTLPAVERRFEVLEAGTTPTQSAPRLSDGYGLQLDGRTVSNGPCLLGRCSVTSGAASGSPANPTRRGLVPRRTSRTSAGGSGPLLSP